VLTALDKDVLYDVKDENLIFLIDAVNDSVFATSVSKLDIHVMNKQSLIRNSTKLLELI
jgi:hypothetical protein